MTIVHNGTCTQNCDVLTDIRIAKEAGYDGIEIIGEKLYRHLDRGFDIETVQKALDGFGVDAGFAGSSNGAATKIDQTIKNTINKIKEMNSI